MIASWYKVFVNAELITELSETIYKLKLSIDGKEYSTLITKKLVNKCDKGI